MEGQYNISAGHMTLDQWDPSKSVLQIALFTLVREKCALSNLMHTFQVANGCAAIGHMTRSSRAMAAEGKPRALVAKYGYCNGKCPHLRVAYNKIEF